MKTKMVLLLGLAGLALLAAPIRAESVDEQVQKYFELAAAGKDVPAAKKLGDGILAGADKDANTLNEFAWKIMTEEGLAHRDLDLAMRVAKAAFDVSEGKEAAIVDTYARAFFDTGKIDDALRLQKKAVELCQDDNLKSELEETLKRYEKKKAETK